MQCKEKMRKERRKKHVMKTKQKLVTEQKKMEMLGGGGWEGDNK